MAIRFDTGTDRLIANDGMPSGNVFTFTCWAKVTVDRNTYSEIVSFGDTYTSLATDADGTSIGLFDGGSHSGAPFGSTNMTPGTWYQFGVVINGANLDYYRSAEGQALVLSSTGDLSSPNPPTVMTLGSYFGGGFWWNGCLAAFKLWDAALALSEVEAELAQYDPVRTADLVRYHSFIESPGLADESGNGNDLTAGSTATATEAGPDIPVSGSSFVVRYWGGAAWQDATDLRYYDGVDWQSAVDIRTWDGSSWG